MGEKKSCIDYCPFTHKACTECGIYRGRHRHFLPANGSGIGRITEYFKAVDKQVDLPQKAGTERSPVITFSVMDMENKRKRVCDFTEAKTWDWGDPTVMRLIDGWQVKSYSHLVEILCDKEDRGHREAELQECPRFMLLSGG